MISGTGIITHAVILPVVHNNITRRGDIGIILFPTTDLLIKIDHCSASAFSRRDLCQAGFNKHGAHKSCAPCVCVFHGIASCKRFVTVIEVDDFSMRAIAFLASEILLCDRDYFGSQFFFCHGITPLYSTASVGQRSALYTARQPPLSKASEAATPPHYTH